MIINESIAVISIKACYRTSAFPPIKLLDDSKCSFLLRCYLITHNNVNWKIEFRSLQPQSTFGLTGSPAISSFLDLQTLWEIQEARDPSPHPHHTVGSVTREPRGEAHEDRGHHQELGNHMSAPKLRPDARPRTWKT